MKQQRGITLGGMVIFLAFVVLAIYAGTRIVPAYVDYWLIGRALDNVVSQPNVQSDSDESIREQFEKQLRFNNVTVVTRSDLLIEREAGGMHLSVPISARRPFMGPISICMDFLAEARAGGAQ